MPTISSDGFVIVERALGGGALARLDAAIERRLARREGPRNLLDDAAIAGLVTGPPMLELVTPVLGPGAFAVRALLLEKTPASNWRVAFHQDLAIAVRRRVEAPGFSGWSLKAGVPHVLAPASILDGVVAVRIHLDDCDEESGPLRVLPGSHRAGRIRETEIAAWHARIPETTCLVPRGGALLMRPLLLHASSPTAAPRRRRVIHVEVAASGLPEGMEWRWAAAMSGAERE